MSKIAFVEESNGNKKMYSVKMSEKYENLPGVRREKPRLIKRTPFKR